MLYFNRKKGLRNSLPLTFSETFLRGLVFRGLAILSGLAGALGDFLRCTRPLPLGFRCGGDILCDLSRNEAFHRSSFENTVDRFTLCSFFAQSASNGSARSILADPSSRTYFNITTHGMLSSVGCIISQCFAVEFMVAMQNAGASFFFQRASFNVGCEQ